MNSLRAEAAAIFTLKSGPGSFNRPSIRVVVVDDFEPFRRFAISMLSKEPVFQVVGEAKDGEEAIQKVHTLKPDLVILDIGLPKLNGLEAARRIRRASNCKILFLTGNPYPEVMREALNAGANGYVLKVDAASELWPALQAVLLGKRYVSNRFDEQG
jgi:DNA-binding NarL/FixJ family response regulator